MNPLMVTLSIVPSGYYFVKGITNTPLSSSLQPVIVPLSLH